MTAEEYRGEATLRLGDEEISVQVRLSARFEPVEGRYRWAGRTGPDAGLTARVRGGGRDATLLIGGIAVPTRLGDPDPWGGVRLTGVGVPPWPARSG
jgi:Domain of unknown function (DUF4873)